LKLRRSNAFEQATENTDVSLSCIPYICFDPLSKHYILFPMEDQKSFAIPLSVGWILNIVGWVVFISTMDHTLEFITALVCMGCVYVGYKHKQIGTAPFMIDRMSAGNLIYASAFEAVWMLCWALEIF